MRRTAKFVLITVMAAMAAAPGAMLYAVVAASKALAAPSRTVRLSGTLHVTFVTSKSNPDLGLSYTFRGKGTLHPFGKVRMHGAAQAPGNISVTTPIGQLTLSNQRGSVTLRLVYPSSPGFSQLPASGTFSIVGATGTYAGDLGHGKFATNLSAPTCNPAAVLMQRRCRGTGDFHFTAQKRQVDPP